uniref:Uncharacterized protein n=1 Tax=Anguilla anguilla TaxID=7936 RepID=A0A0E9UYR5_ANGAN
MLVLLTFHNCGSDHSMCS